MLPIKIRESKEYKNMYYLVWEDGIRSKDYYNIIRAKAYLHYLPTREEQKFNKRAP
jgi:hypothetical protein